MYPGNNFGRRRPEGWAERRRYFRRLLAKTRPENAAKSDEKSQASSKPEVSA